MLACEAIDKAIATAMARIWNWPVVCPRQGRRVFVSYTMRSICNSLLCLLISTFTVAGCSDDPEPGTTVLFDLSGDVRTQEEFYNFPFPSDLRLKDGSPDLSGYPNPSNNILLQDLMPLGSARTLYATTSASYFQFSAELGKRDENDLIAADKTSPILLVDIDPNSPEFARLIPTVARTMADDDYLPPNVLAVAPRPGFILRGNGRYAMVIMKSLGDAQGNDLDIPKALQMLAAGETPEGAWGVQARELYTPLWTALDMIGVDKEQVAAATVYSTGDVVAELAELSDAVRTQYTLSLDNIAVDPDDGDHERFCELIGTVSFPQFQTGTPPFNGSGTGVFEYDASGGLVLQRMEEAGFVISLPKGEMPIGGYPLAMYFHGSGGLYEQVIDRGRVVAEGETPTKGEGPAFVLAPHGFAMVGSAHPVNPQRLPGAKATEYLNLNNLSTLPFTFSQGAIEQRLLLDALLDLELSDAMLSGCTDMVLPSGETSFHFAEDKVVAMGQSMGGMYTNIIGAIEPRIRAVVPTGAGGLWHYFILETELVPDAKGFLSVIFRTPEEEFTFLHPTLQLLGMAWEVAEPMVYMPRLAKDPLPGHPARPIYEPAGKGDSYFPTSIYDAAALSYGNQQAGDSIWDSMQDALALDSLDGFIDYPVSSNLESTMGESYTGVVVQYEGDGIYDPHSIFAQLDAVKHQYGCFFESFIATGIATIPAPAALGSACP